MSQSWDRVYESKDVENKYQMFVNIFYFHFNNACPERTTKTRIKSNPWYTIQLYREKENLNDTYNQIKYNQMS